MTGEPRRLDRSEVAWAAWRLTAEGRIQVALTLRSDDGIRRVRRDYAGLDAAAAELGASFRTVFERVREAGGDRGRWRP